MRCAAKQDVTIKNYAVPPCPINHKLCVTCFAINNETYIRYQSNNIPNHCFTHDEATVDGAVDF